MSNAAYSGSRYRKVPAPPPRVMEDDQGEPFEDEPVYGETYDYGEGEEVEQASSLSTTLFSTPARTITLVFSVLLLFAMVGAIAWMLGRSGKPTTDSQVGSVSTMSDVVTPSSSNVLPASGSLIPVAQINNSSAPYNSKPNGLAEAPRIGALPPNFQWVDNKTGKTMTLEAMRGKPLLLNFWGTWCPPCRAEMPEMQKLYNDKAGSVSFLGVSMGPRDEPLGVAQFVQLSKYTWDFIHDGDSNVMNRYQVTGIPSSYYIDKNGVIRAITVGGADGQMLKDNLAKAEQSN